MATRYINLIIIIFILVGPAAHCQDKQLKKGNDAFKGNQYQPAIQYYEKARKKTKSKLRKDKIAHQLALCYALSHDDEKAYATYQGIAGGKYAEKNHQVWLEYADQLRRRGEYEEAMQYYEKYLEGDPSSFTAINGKRSCAFAMDFGNSRGSYEIESIDLINSGSDEFGATYATKNFNQLIISSNREKSTGNKYDNWTGNKFSDLYEVNLGKRGVLNPPLLIDQKQKINTDDHEGVPFYAQKSKTLYFTRCPRVVDEKNYCGIWASKRQGTIWSEPTIVLSFESANAGHPSLSADELTIYFSSNMPGGQGGKDIWMAKREKVNKSFGEPVNLGPAINTELNEVFPYTRGDSLLYFSSEGHPGFGGLDVFYCQLDQSGNISDPFNLLPPVNSSGNDFAFVVHPEKEEGFVSSDRKGGKGGDDIYFFRKRDLVFNIEGQITDRETGLILPGSDVYLINDQGDTITTQSDKNGDYAFSGNTVTDVRNYIIVASRPDYFSAKHDIFTESLTADHTFTIDLSLEPMRSKPIVLPEVLYDYGKWDIKPQYHDSLMILMDILETNPNIVIEIGAHTDSRDDDEFNDNLSLKRAQSVVDFLIDRGIEPDRVVAKGYGERVPRLLDKDFDRNGFKFAKGTSLNDSYIGRLPTLELREYAHQLNRRTEFAVISRNYISHSGAAVARKVNIVTDRDMDQVDYEIVSDSIIMLEVGLNEFTINAIIHLHSRTTSMNEEFALLLLEKGYINKNNMIGREQDWQEKGRIKTGSVLVMDRVRIGGIVIRDVRFLIEPGQEERIRFGRDFIDQFSTFRPDDNKLKITIERK